MKISYHFLPFSHLRALVAAAVGAGALSLAPSLPAATGGGMAGYEVIGLGRGHLNRILMAATVDGKKGLMVVDTGAAGSFLSADKYGFLLPSTDRQLPPGVPKTASVNGMNVPVGYARSFQVGKTNLGSLPLRIVPARYLNDQQMLYHKEKRHDYDGFLGEDVLRHCHAILDAGRLILYLNIDPKKRVDPGRGLIAAGWTRIPLSDLGHDLTAECKLGDKNFRVIVDSGSPFTAFDPRAVQSSHVSTRDLPMTGGIIGTRAQRVGLVIADTLTIGSYVATDVHLVANGGLADSLRANFNDNAPLVGLLGGDILAKHNAIIDIGNHALYLKRSATGKKP